MRFDMRYFLSAAALALGLALAPVAGNAKSDGKAFLKEAIQGNLAEVELGKLAQEKSKNADVQAYGKMLADDHGQANEKAQAMAQQMGVEAPRQMSAKQQADVKRLQSLEGAAFDRMFVAHMIKDHKKDIKDYTRASEQMPGTQTSGKMGSEKMGLGAGAGQVADYAKETLPTLEKHLKAAEDLKTKVMGTKSGS